MRETTTSFVVRGTLSEVFDGLFVVDTFEHRMRRYANVQVGQWQEDDTRDIVLRLPASNPIARLLRTDRAGASIRQAKLCPEPDCIVVTGHVVPNTFSERHVSIRPTVVMRPGASASGAPVVDVHVSTSVSVTLPQPVGFLFGSLLETLLLAFCSRVNGVFRDFGTGLSPPSPPTGPAGAVSSIIEARA